MNARTSSLWANVICLMLMALACPPLFGQQSFGSGPATPAIYKPVVGDAHPDFILPGIADGKPVRLSDFRGQKVLLVHFASW